MWSQNSSFDVEKLKNQAIIPEVVVIYMKYIKFNMEKWGKQGLS